MSNQDIEEIFEANLRQKEFYNASREAKKSLPTKIWFGLRNRLLDPFRGNFNIKSRVYDQHKLWLGDLSDKKVLDLGCFKGNTLSIYMAKNAKKYIGIDLSDKAIEVLNRKLKKADCANAKAIAVDFLSPQFQERDFDVIYAYGVLHHFQNLEILFQKLNEKLADDGFLISYDPMDTSLPIRLFRKMYRPFQSDKDWEWPFTKKALKEIEKNFEVLELRGILGNSKYGLLLNLLPLKKSYKDQVVENMIDKDWGARDIRDVYNCMHVTLLLQKSNS